MRLTDILLLALLGFAILGIADPAAASDALGNLFDHLRAILP